MPAAESLHKQAASRNFGLDALRGVAITVVLMNHALIGFWTFGGKLHFARYIAFLSYLTYPSIEWLFVLSGFLIGIMMIRSFQKGSDWWHRARSFWLRRWFRTVPNYYLFLLINLLLVHYGFGEGRFSWEYLVFAQNLAGREAIPIFFVESWSLALDEWFYLTMPVLLGLFALLIPGRMKSTFLAATALLIAVPILVRLLSPAPTSVDQWDLWYRRITLSHLDATGWGVMAAVASHWFPRAWAVQKGLKAIAGLLCMAAGMYLYMIYHHGGYMYTHLPHVANALNLTLIALGTALLLPWITTLRQPGEGIARGVLIISNYTYSIYLTHFPLIYILRRLIPLDADSSWAAYIGLTLLWLLLTIATAALIFHVFEKPVTDLRERFTRKIDARPFGTEAPPP